MATFKEGVFGGFSGKVGNVVGASWRGIDYMRSLPLGRKDAKTKRQVKQRGKFSVTMDFLRTMTPFLRVGFQSGTNGTMTEFNAAMSYNMKFAVQVKHQEAVLDYSKVLVSQGELTPALGIHAGIAGRELQVCWEDAPTWSDDVTMVLAYNPAKRASEYDINAGKRAHCKTTLPLPVDWSGDEVETYIAFKSADGTLVSDSVYTGRHLVP